MTRNRQTALEAIRQHYLSDKEEKLTEKEAEIHARLKAAHALLCNYHSIEQALPIHRAEFGVSEPTAYRDFKDALRLFGDIKKSEKEGYRYILYEMMMKTFQLAAKNGDYKTMSDTTGKMAKLMGLDRDEPDMPDFEKLEPNVYPIVMDEATKALFLALASRPGTVDISEMMKQAREAQKAEDAEFEEIPADDQRTDKS